MCSSFFSQMMENDPDGLAHIVRTSDGGGASITAHTFASWQFPPEAVALPSLVDGPLDNFVDAFADFHDPLMNEFAGTAFLGASDCMVGLARMGVDRGDRRLDGGASSKPNDGASVVESSRAQISSSQTLGAKKRKNQAKKVVCIAAPTAASSKTTGEVVPADQWAWRKYGQKPIKGSPYPRSYYKCSSLKGCLARKQVERSRTDPTMLVITYTSEHNHPWPTQRNALAGSTRSQSAKNESSALKDSRQNRRAPLNLKEEFNMVKEKIEGTKNEIGIDDDDEFDSMFRQSFKPAVLELNHSDDFFTNLGELEGDPMDLHLTKGFLGNKSDEERENKALDPFSFFDWGQNSFGEAKGGL